MVAIDYSVQLASFGTVPFTSPSRDIKPSNILVTLHDGRPVPTVIDFGITKAIEGKLTEKTLLTACEQLE